MLGDKCEQQEEECYHGGEDASRDPRSFEMRSHAKRSNLTHTTACTDRRGYAQWPSSLILMDLAIPGTRRRGRPRKTWHQQIKEDMTGVGVTQDMALGRKEWKQRTRPTLRR